MIQIGGYYVLFSFEDVMKSKEIRSVRLHDAAKMLSVIDIHGDVYEIIPPKKYPAIYTIEDGIFKELDENAAKAVYSATIDEINATTSKLERLEKLKESISKKYFGTV